MQRKIRAFFRKKITIAKWQFNLFGLACFSLGTVWGIYLMISGVYPKIFAANSPISITKTAADAEFSGGKLSSTRIVGSGASARVQLDVGGFWTSLDDAPFVYNPIGDMVSDNDGAIYVMPGDGYVSPSAFWKYDIASGVWTQLANTPAATDFTSLTYDGSGAIFALRNRSMNPYPEWTSDLWKYDISSNVWSQQGNAPANVGAGTVVSDKNGNLFVHTGSSGSFWRYNIGANTWNPLSNAPDYTSHQSAAYDNNGNIFYFQGTIDHGYNGGGNFWKYSIGSDSWSVMDTAPGIAWYGSSLEYSKNGKFFSPGDTTGVFWRYNKDGGVGSWDVLQSPPGAISGLIYNDKNNDNSIYALGSWGESTFYKFNFDDPKSGFFETAPIETDWNTGWVNGNSFVANVEAPSGTLFNFSIKVASSIDGLANADYVPLIGSIDSGIFTANLNDPNGDNDTSDAIASGENRYVKIKVSMNTDNLSSQPKVSSITLNYTKDETAPSQNASEIKMTKSDSWWDSETPWTEIADGGWIKTSYAGSTKFSWKNGEDLDSEIAGYCLYLGTEIDGDPIGFDPNNLLTGQYGAGNNKSDKCLYFVAEDPYGQTTANIANDGFYYYQNTFKYYLKVRALNNAGLPFEGAIAQDAQISFSLDQNAPTSLAFIGTPEKFVDPGKTPITISWPTEGTGAANDMNCYAYDGGDNGDEFGCGCKTFDGDGKCIEYKYDRELSGVAGFQYAIGNNPNDEDWYGPNHIGNEMSDVFSPETGSYTLTDLDIAKLKEGTNYIWMKVWDKAGNYNDSSRMRGIIKINTNAPSEPNDLRVEATEPKKISIDPAPEVFDHSSSVKNSFKFSWSVPNDFAGKESGDNGLNLMYCYTVNNLPSDESCTFTSRDACSLTAGKVSCNLPADSFAKRPGENTFYLVAKDVNDRINYEVYSLVNFSYFGDPPPELKNVDVADISIKKTQNWKLIVSWDPPTEEGVLVDEYRIFRSEQKTSCGVNAGAFGIIGSTAGTSFADTGLSQKEYFYCVKACDSANNCSPYSNTVSMIPTGKFTEPANMVGGPDIRDITTSKATISWATDRDSDSRVVYGEKEGEYFKEEPSKSAQVTEHNINLNDLSPGTRYFYRMKWTDEDGNTGSSSEKTFKTQPAPTVSDVKNDDISIVSARIKFTTKGASKAKIYYGTSTSFGSAKEIQTSNNESDYVFDLNNLTDDTKYYYKINTFDAEDKEYEGTTLDFKTLPRPKISDVQIQQVKDSAQPAIQVTWQSNTEISSVVTYAPANNPAENKNYVQVDLISGDHEAVIMDLRPLTTYQLTIKGVDKAGNEAISDTYSFTTASDTRPPQISDINVEGSATNNQNEKLSQLSISWNTDESATSQVEFGEGVGTSYTQKTQEDSNLTNNHLVIISGLTPSKVYHFRIISKDQADNIANSQDTVSITPKAIDSAFELVIGNLVEVFGFLKGLQN